MSGLERNSPAPFTCLRNAPAGRMRHPAHQSLARHRHDAPFAAVVISGRYVEAGDTGRHEVGPGEVIVHRAYENHLDRFAECGAEVLVLPLPHGWNAPVLGAIDDIDEIVRLAERSPAMAAEKLKAEFVAKPAVNQDWPALLAAALRTGPDLCLRDWAEGHGLHHGSLSRGFRQEFSVSPARFRLISRMHRALQLIDRSTDSLANIACDAGFSDQAHLTRTVRSETGMTPMQLMARSGETTGLLAG
ncbi:AraC family transcriptional regulator [Novosphingobium sp. PhB165]|nr:AraC family transcriptional regulator [Novosphingobium sp. PhB165]